ncbi:hypothetical protein EXN66_Car000130 [Channa argus]|uniref:Uncharacterized protein n=1 Tax=Channa argus TaxID=215402 RepID=A0A6G1QXB0_CHAAH|nr:hypothetical protein EXN66_Car000130 [Channa argus]
MKHLDAPMAPVQIPLLGCDQVNSSDAPCDIKVSVLVWSRRGVSSFCCVLDHNVINEK